MLGDGEPHGAGAVGIRGCRDTAPDLRGLKTTDVLQQMRAAGRTLVMVRQGARRRWSSSATPEWPRSPPLAALHVIAGALTS